MLSILLLLSGLAHAQTNIFECAKNQTKMREMFPVEMRYLKSFEGVWSDTPFKTDSMSSDFRAFNINSNKNKIQIQMEVSRDGQTKTSPVKDAMICNSRNGPVIRADGIEIPIIVLNDVNMSMKIAGKWYRFARTDDKHIKFGTATETEFSLSPGSPQKLHQQNAPVATPTPTPAPSPSPTPETPQAPANESGGSGSGIGTDSGPGSAPSAGTSSSNSRSEPETTGATQ